MSAFFGRALFGYLLARPLTAIGQQTGLFLFCTPPIPRAVHSRDRFYRGGGLDHYLRSPFVLTICHVHDWRCKSVWLEDFLALFAVWINCRHELWLAPVAIPLLHNYCRSSSSLAMDSAWFRSHLLASMERTHTMSHFWPSLFSSLASWPQTATVVWVVAFHYYWSTPKILIFPHYCT